MHLPCSVRALESSPALQRWDYQFVRSRVLEGRLKGRMSVVQSSLRDSAPSTLRPSAEALGYSQSTSQRSISHFHPKLK